MIKCEQLRRLLYIQYVLVKYGLDDMLSVIPIFTPIRFLKCINPWFWFRKQSLSRGERVCFAFQTLGPIFIKLGQMLSTRDDLIPEDIAKALSTLQDKVPPFPDAQKVLELHYHYDVKKAFHTFEHTPIASASIAQVHLATLYEGSKVAVKILRPNISKRIRKDIHLMFLLAKIVERYWPTGKLLNLTQIVKEFETTINQELDFTREAANASLLKRHFKDSPQLAIPEIYWSLSNNKVLVMEYVTGIPIYDKPTLEKQGINLKKLSENIIQFFFTQVLFHRFFHADLHPGNLFVNPQNPNNPQCIAVDFGIMGSLNSTDQRYLAENMLAFLKRDYQRVAELHIASGWVPANTRIEAFEGAIRTVCEPIFEKPLNEISVGQTLKRLLQTAQDFKMEVLPQFILLQKTLLNVESLGRQLHPTINIWETAQPILKEWLKKQIGVRATLCKLRSQIPYWLEKMPHIPELFYEQLKHKAQISLSENKTLIIHKNTLSNTYLIPLGISFLMTAFLITYCPKVISYVTFLKPISPNWFLVDAGIFCFFIYFLSHKRN